MSPREKTVTLASGLRLRYAEQGDPAGVPLILLHGYSDSWHSYELLLEQLPHAVHAYALTQRGHGDADRPHGGYRPEDQAADVAMFLDAMGLERAVIAGHSGGSYTAQRFALDHPDRTMGLVLIAAFHRFATPEVRELGVAVEALTDPVDPGFVREFQAGTVSEPVPAAFFETVVAESAKLPARVWKAYLRDMTGADVPSEAGVIEAPALILWGDRDAYCSREAQDALVAALPAARLVTHAGVGHCPHWERPAQTAEEIVAFAARLTRHANGRPSRAA